MRRIERKIRRKAPNSEGTWAVSYGDMITLLLGFFILFFSLEPQRPKNTVLSESLLAALQGLDQKLEAGMETADSPSSSSGTEKMQAADKSAGQQALEGDHQKTKDEVSNQGQELGGMSISEQLLDFAKMIGLGEQSQRARTAPEDAAKSSKSDESSTIAIPALDAQANRVGDRIVIKFPNISFFDTAQTGLTREGEAVLKTFASSYLPFAGSTILNIVGFADPRKIPRGMYRFRDNLELSVLRAVSAQRLLESQGIPLARTKLMGFGVKENLTLGEFVESQEERLALSRKIMLIIEPTGETL